MSHPITKRYSNGDVTIVWKPDLCRHSGICARGLPKVFNPSRRPWVDPMAADSETLIAQVDRCPSRALTWTRDSDEDTQ